MLRAATACTFSTSQLQKVVRHWCVLYILTCKCASRHNGVHFFIFRLASWLRTRRFSEPTFRPSGATNHWKNTGNRDFPTFSRICIFFLLIFSLLTILTSAFQLSILSEVSLLNFLRLIQRVTLLYSFNVQLSPILKCSLTFPTPLHFRTNKMADFISAPHPLEWPSGNSIEWPSTDWPKMVLLFMLNLLLSIGLDVRIFSNFTAIPIASFSTYQEAWIFEHLLISSWQPPLNHPFITKILRLKASGWLVQYKKHFENFPSLTRLFQRLRRRLITKGVPSSSP